MINSPLTQYAQQLINTTDHMRLCNVMIFDHIDSTQTFIHSLNKPTQQYTLAMALSQQQGQGQHQRQWASPKGNAYFTLSIPLNSIKPIKPFWALQIALNLLSLCQPLTHKPLWLKWPNDLYTELGKIGGILTEISAHHMNIGVGINVNHPPNLPKTDSLALNFSNQELVKFVIDACGLIIQACQTTQFDHQHYHHKHLLTEQNITIIHDNISKDVTVKRVSPEGYLEVFNHQTLALELIYSASIQQFSLPSEWTQ